MTQYRVIAASVQCRTANSAGVGLGGGFLLVDVGRDRLLPSDAPTRDIVRLLFKGAVEAVDGEVDPEVAAQLEQMRAARHRPPAPPLPASSRLVNAMHRGGVQTSAMHEEFLAALVELVDERVALSEGRTHAEAVR